MTLENASNLPVNPVKNSPGHPNDHKIIHAAIKEVATAFGGRLSESYLNGLYSQKNEIFFNVKNFGAKGDGTTNDTAAINAAIAAMPSIPNSWGNGASGVLYFPAGRYITNGGHIIPNDKRMKIMGAAAYSTIINQRAGQTSDLFTVNAGNSGLSDITLAGAREAAAGDLLVLNAGYGFAENMTLSGANNNAITVGKSGGSIVHRLTNINIRDPRGYGIHTVASSGSTDGQWTNIDIGHSGLSAVRIETGSQMLLNVHVWGSGMESDTDKHGFWLSSTSTQLVGCQSECNRGYGIQITPSGSNAQDVIGCKIWGNGSGAIYGFQAQKIVLSGNNIYRNCVNNTSGSTAFAYSAIGNDGGVEWAVQGNNIWDDGGAIPAGPSNFTYSYPGRTAGSAQQTAAYREQNAADFNSITGNLMRAERTRSGVPIVLTGSHSAQSGNVFGATQAALTIASAATITVPPTSEYYEITGTTQITAINPSKLGRRVTFVFTNASPAGMTDGATIKLASAYAPVQNGTITLICAGSVWRETSRT